LGKYADRLAAARQRPTPPGGPDEWARESCELVDQRALYPQTHKMGVRYLKAMRPLAEQRVTRAANRLARLLNELLASPTASP